MPAIEPRSSMGDDMLGIWLTNENVKKRHVKTSHSLRSIRQQETIRIKGLTSWLNIMDMQWSQEPATRPYHEPVYAIKLDCNNSLNRHILATPNLWFMATKLQSVYSLWPTPLNTCSSCDQERRMGWRLFRYKKRSFRDHTQVDRDDVSHRNQHHTCLPHCGE
jgi:hypothetical protein